MMLFLSIQQGTYWWIAFKR